MLTVNAVAPRLKPGVGPTDMVWKERLRAGAITAILFGVVHLRVASKCVEYSPITVRLAGKLVRQTFAGPPNYESIAKGDRAETYWFVALESPRCVNGKPVVDSPEADNVKDVRKVQLKLDPELHKTHQRLLGKRVVASGTLYAGISGRHHTPVLLDVNTLEEAP